MLPQNGSVASPVVPCTNRPGDLAESSERQLVQNPEARSPDLPQMLEFQKEMN
jgi:hypothetical protein